MNTFDLLLLFIIKTKQKKIAPKFLFLQSPRITGITESQDIKPTERRNAQNQNHVFFSIWFGRMRPINRQMHTHTHRQRFIHKHWYFQRFSFFFFCFLLAWFFTFYIVSNFPEEKNQDSNNNNKKTWKENKIVILDAWFIHFFPINILFFCSGKTMNKTIGKLFYRKNDFLLSLSLPLSLGINYVYRKV